MIPPHLAVQSVMVALQMNDYPEEDAGARTAYLFSMPYGCQSLIAGQVVDCKTPTTRTLKANAAKRLQAY